MASAVDICNRALQIVGATTIVALTEDTRNARACNVAYAPQRQRLLRRYIWSFAKKRTVLAPDPTAPAFGFTTKFQLPSDFMRLAGPDVADPDDQEDWTIEGRTLLSNIDTTSVNLIYVQDVTDVNQMDPSFREALSGLIAAQIAEPLTQSQSKYERAVAFYEDAINEAKRNNAIEKVSKTPPTDEWITARL